MSANLISGSTTFIITPHSATLYQDTGANFNTITAAQDNVSPTFIACSDTATVRPQITGSGLLVIVPGELHVPGSPSGKNTLVTSTQTAGVPFNVTVDCVDSFNNIMPAVSVLVKLTSTDPNDKSGSQTGIGWDPLNQTLINGSTVYNITLMTGNSNITLTAKHDDATLPYYGQTNSDNIHVNPANATRLWCCFRTKHPYLTLSTEGLEFLIRRQPACSSP